MAEINYFEAWLNEKDVKEKNDMMFKISCNRSIYKLFVEQAKAWADSKTRKIYKYFITFTTRPETRKGSEEFLIMQSKREGLALKSFIYCKEHEEANLHYHVYLESYSPLEKSSFKHWIKTRGNIDFKRVTPGTEEQTKSYLYKEGEPVSLV